jgi:ubiquitin carboxyl-terminal hydrolase L5
MFNLLAIRSNAIPRLERLVKSDESMVPVWADQLESERHKAERGRVENALRRNNLLPVVFELLKGMGESGMMSKCYSVPADVSQPKR